MGSHVRKGIGIAVLLSVAVLVVLATGREIWGSLGPFAIDVRGAGERELGPLEVRPTLEHRTAEGALYTPSTQSLLRTHSLLETADRVRLRIDDLASASVELLGPPLEVEEPGAGSEPGAQLSFHNVPLHLLVPRLHYRPAGEGDEMDALVLMLAEYSRNGLSMPFGRAGDSMAHFRTSLDGRVPWKLRGDFDFEPNPDYRPQRAAVINNCLAPGLWELSATDRSGEIYHSWFEMPQDAYFDLVAEVNGVSPELAESALAWSDQPVPLDLARLREPLGELGTVPVASLDEPVSFSSQDSRRKLHRDFVLYEVDGERRSPQRLGDLQHHPVWMSSFVPPGLYSSKAEERTRFELGFLAEPVGASLRRVRPRTDYAFDQRPTTPAAEGEYLEMVIEFANGEKLIVGNLPERLLVRQEDYVLHGFGVGILPASDFAERRRFLIEEGHRPSYAFLVRPGDEAGQLLAQNSHGRGLEQIFLRALPDAEEPHFLLTLSSYERIVDLARLRIGMPEELVASQQAHSERYVSPIYFTYRDDNVN